MSVPVLSDDSPHAVECELVEEGGAFAAHRPTDANRSRRVAFVDGTLRTEARLIRTGDDGDVSMGLVGSWATGAVLGPEGLHERGGAHLADARSPLDVAPGEELPVELLELADGVGDGEEPPSFAGTVQMATTPALRLGPATVAASSSTSAGGPPDLPGTAVAEAGRSEGEQKPRVHRER